MPKKTFGGLNKRLSRTFWVVWLLLAQAVAAWAVSETRPPAKAPFKLLYNNDALNVLTLESPFHKRGEPISDQAIAGSIDEVAPYGVDAYLLSPGNGHFPWWKSQRTMEVSSEAATLRKRTEKSMARPIQKAP